MDAKARRVAQGRKSDTPWGDFVVRIVGRVGVAPHQPRYLGDGVRTILVERLVSVAKAR